MTDTPWLVACEHGITLDEGHPGYWRVQHHDGGQIEVSALMAASMPIITRQLLDDWLAKVHKQGRAPE